MAVWVLALGGTAAVAPTAPAASRPPRVPGGGKPTSGGGRPSFGKEARGQSTQLLTRTPSGDLPNGPSTNAVISGDRRWARVIAFESEASNLVDGDGNGATKDVFAIERGGSFGNNGSPWKPGRTRLISRGRGGAANGPSYSPAVDGSFDSKASCVAFLSQASNLVSGDDNGRADAFVSRGPGGSPSLVSTPGGKQGTQDTTDVAVSGDCNRIAFVTGGSLYVRVGNRVTSLGAGVDPSWSTGQDRDADLVYTGTAGVMLSNGGTARGRLIAKGARNPAYNNIKRNVVAYEKQSGGHTQVLWHDLGKKERAASGNGGSMGDGDSSNPVIGNSGFYIAFQSDASNLQTNAGGARSDDNGAGDVYLYTDQRKITLLESVAVKGQPQPGGGANPSMSFYANYIVWDSPAPLGTGGPRQVYMRYLGPV